MVMMVDANEQNRESARSKMSAICDPLGISKKLLLDGNPAQVLHQVAQDQEAGGHGCRFSRVSWVAGDARGDGQFCFAWAPV